MIILTGNELSTIADIIIDKAYYDDSGATIGFVQGTWIENDSLYARIHLTDGGSFVKRII